MIETDRLVLRRARAGDLGAFHTMMTDPRVMRYWSCPPHENLAQTQAFLQHLMQSEAQDSEEFVIEHEGRCIGKAGCWRPAEVGFLLHPAFWGHGFAREAVRAILPYCFAKYADAPCLTADCDPRNVRSVTLLKKLGFVHLRTVEKDFLYGEEWCDTAYFDLPRP
ncbi:MAG: GNAT family N-acetyltransferase [Roseobacter sp.]